MSVASWEEQANRTWQVNVLDKRNNGRWHSVSHSFLLRMGSVLPPQPIDVREHACIYAGSRNMGPSGMKLPSPFGCVRYPAVVEFRRLRCLRPALQLLCLLGRPALEVSVRRVRATVGRLFQTKGCVEATSVWILSDWLHGNVFGVLTTFKFCPKTGSYSEKTGRSCFGYRNRQRVDCDSIVRPVKVSSWTTALLSLRSAPCARRRSC